MGVGPFHGLCAPGVPANSKADRIGNKQKLGVVRLGTLKPPATGCVELWDGRVPGLSFRFYASGRTVWNFRYRAVEGVSHRRIKIGEYPEIGLAQARKRAAQLRGQVFAGQDPQAARKTLRTSKCLDALVKLYMSEEVEPKRKQATAALYRSYFRNHLPQQLKRQCASNISREDIARLHREIGRRQPATANRFLVTLSGLFSWAHRNGHLDGDHNPARHIQKFREQSRERFLSENELARLGAALRLAETAGIPWRRPFRVLKHGRKTENRQTILPIAITSAFRLLIFTGCRLREILNLTWPEVDLENGLLHLKDSKTGRRSVVLNSEAVQVLAKLSGCRKGLYVIAGNSVQKPKADLKRSWDILRDYAGLEGVRIHDLRHTHASIAVNSGVSLAFIGGLLGHRHASTTQKYAHLRNDPLRIASNEISARLARAMGETGRN